MCSSQFPSDPLPIAQSVASAKGWDGATRAMMLAAKQLPILPEALRTAQHYVPGCDSDVWLGEVASDASASMQEGTCLLDHFDAAEPTTRVDIRVGTAG